MKDNARADLAKLIRGFLHGNDRSLSYVSQIEGLLIEEFMDTDLFEELSPYLAMYRPGGGEHLYDEKQLAREFRYIITNFLGEEVNEEDH